MDAVKKTALRFLCVFCQLFRPRIYSKYTRYFVKLGITGGYKDIPLLFLYPSRDRTPQESLICYNYCSDTL